MKALLVFGLVAACLVATQASAVEYYARCQSCTGGPSTGASWFAAAIALAQAKNAQEDDYLVVCKQSNPTYSVLGIYLVTHDPVVNSSHIPWHSSVGYDAGCNDFGV